MSEQQASLERQLVDASVTPRLQALAEATVAADAAASMAETAEAFSTVSQWAGLAEANAPKPTLALLAKWAGEWQVTVDRTQGEEAAAFLGGALTVYKAVLSEAEVQAITEAVAKWQATAPKGKRSRKAEGDGPVQWSTVCGLCQKTIEDRTNLNSARWGVQQHMQSKHAQKWGEKAKKGSPDYEVITQGLDKGEDFTVRGVTFKVTRVEAEGGGEAEAKAS